VGAKYIVVGKSHRGFLRFVNAETLFSMEDLAFLGVIYKRLKIVRALFHHEPEALPFRFIMLRCDGQTSSMITVLARDPAV